MSSKIAKGSIVILMGFFLYRIGGYIYKVAMANLLGPAGYGILSLTWPLQGFFIIIAGCRTATGYCQACIRVLCQK